MSKIIPAGRYLCLCVLSFLIYFVQVKTCLSARRVGWTDVIKGSYGSVLRFFPGDKGIRSGFSNHVGRAV